MNTQDRLAAALQRRVELKQQQVSLLAELQETIMRPIPVDALNIEFFACLDADMAQYDALKSELVELRRQELAVDDTLKRLESSQ